MRKRKGFYFAPPLDAESFEAALRAQGKQNRPSPESDLQRVYSRMNATANGAAKALGSGLMSRRTIVQLEDDLTGGEAAESVTFALDGKSFEIDLNEKNAEELRKALAPYIAAGRGQRGVRAAARRNAVADDGVDPATVRAWAVANGYAVSTRGRVSRELRDAYAAALG